MDVDGCHPVTAVYRPCGGRKKLVAVVVGITCGAEDRVLGAGATSGSCGVED